MIGSTQFRLAVLSAIAAWLPVDAEVVLPEDSMAYWLRYQVGGNTLALYEFEPETAGDVLDKDLEVDSDPAADMEKTVELGPMADLSGKSDMLKPGDGVAPVKEGRIGHGLHFASRHAPLQMSIGGKIGSGIFSRGRFIVDFWVKADSLPEKDARAALLYKEHVPDKANGFRLDLMSDGSLVWTHRTLSSRPGGKPGSGSHPEWCVEMKTPPATVHAGQWHHVAVYLGAFIPTAGGDIAYLSVDGRKLAEQPNGWMYIDYTSVEKGPSSMWVGSFNDGRDSFTGTIDQFRCVVGLYRKFFPMPDESWTDPGNKRPAAADPSTSAVPYDILFKAGFEDTLDAEIARGSPKPVKTEGKPSFAPGVRGKALRTVANHSPLSYACKGNLNMEMGAVEMWVKPLGWQHLGSNQTGFFAGDGWKGPMLFIPNDGFTVQVAGGAENMNVEYRPDTWMHFILSWAERQMVLYVNGEKKLESVMPAPFNPAQLPGSFGVGFGKSMLIDEFTIYRRPLCAGEACNHYLSYVGGERAAFGSAACTGIFFQGVGKVLGTAYARGNPSGTPVTARVELSRKGGAAVGMVDVPYKPASGASFLMENLPVPLPEGEYRLSVRLLDASSKAVASAEQPFEFKRYPWLGNRIGISDRVLKPWTPLVTEGNNVSAIGRVHRLGKDGLFEQIINQGKDMLVRPMRLELVSGGAVQTMSAAPDAFKIISSRGHEATWQSAVSGKGLTVGVQGRMEFDGHTVFTLDLRPEGNTPASLDRLSLAVPLRADLPKQYLAVFEVGRPAGLGAQPGYGLLREEDGELFSSKRWYEDVSWDGEMMLSGVFDFRQAWSVDQKKAKLEKRWKPTLGNFMPQIWFGDDLQGLSYMADSDFGWAPSDAQPAMVLERKGAAAEWRFNFISEPFVLKSPRRIVLSFMATPEKPQPENWRKHFWAGPKRDDGGQYCKWLSDGAAWDEEGVGPYKYTPDVAKTSTDSMHAEGFRVTPHLDTSSFNWGGRTASEFSAEWDSGGFQYNQLFTRSKVDFGVWSHQRWKDKYGVDGVYFDTGTPGPNLNTISGSAYLLPDGRVQPGWLMFGQREYYRRSAFVFGDIGGGCYSYSCGYTGPQIAGWQFASVPGGEYRLDYAMDFYPGPFNLMRLYSNSGRWGTIMMWMGLSEYKKIAQAPDNYVSFIRHMLAMEWQLDAKSCFGFANYPQCFFDFCIADPDVRFVGFWNNPMVKYLSPAEGILTGMYLKPDGRAIVIASNLSEYPSKVRMRLDLKAMGGDVSRLELVDGEISEMPVPQQLTPEWHRWIGRGGSAVMPKTLDRKTKPKRAGVLFEEADLNKPEMADKSDMMEKGEAKTAEADVEKVSGPKLDEDPVVDDATMRRIETAPDGDGLDVTLVVPSHDYRLLTVRIRK